MSQQKQLVHLKTISSSLKGDLPPARKKLRKKKFSLLFPIFCASLLCVPFGMMLGWPSPTYPALLEEDTPIFVTFDQTAMIAGFLMIGNVLATPFSSTKLLGTKYGMSSGLGLMLIGWVLMWKATNIYFLLGSRLLIGLGHGFGLGQLKMYINDLCQSKLTTTLTKSVVFYSFFGVIVAFAIGPYVEFEQFSLISVGITGFILAVSLLLPHTPVEYVQFGKLKEAKTMLKLLQPEADTVEGMEKLENKLNETSNEMWLFPVLTHRELRPKFFLVCFLTFAQQFTGVPATIVYSQIIFEETNCHHPELCALLYAVTFFLSNVLGVFYTSTLEKKKCLLVSTMGVAIVLSLQVLVLYFDLTKQFHLIFLLLLLCFIFVHSLGLGCLPQTYIQELFPKTAWKLMTYAHIMLYSALALIITKIFQVLYGSYSLYVPFVLFFFISIFSLVFIAIFVPKTSSSLVERDKPAQNV